MKNAIVFIAASALCIVASAGNVQIQVLDRDGKPVPDAVVVVYPNTPAGAPPSLLQANPTIEQEKMRFVPAVTVVLPGSTVRFTNQDRWDHHVRGAPAGLSAASLSAASATPSEARAEESPNVFELRLSGKAEGTPANFADVKLDHAGVVLLSCHLHGSMRGHVFVTDSAWTLKTDGDGIARFDSVPDGAAQVRVWHAEQLVDVPRKTLKVVPGPVLDTVQLSVVPRVRRPMRSSGAPATAVPVAATLPGAQMAHQH